MADSAASMGLQNASVITTPSNLLNIFPTCQGRSPLEIPGRSHGEKARAPEDPIPCEAEEGLIVNYPPPVHAYVLEQPRWLRIVSIA
jgi:hypothetical protein